jgi:hypothetical protein
MIKTQNKPLKAAALLLIGAGILGGGAAAFASARGSIAPVQQAQIDADVDQPVAAVKPSESCLLVRAIRDHRVPDSGQLEFRTRANTYVKVHFRDECKALNNKSQISYRSTGSRLCRGDEVRILASLGSSADVTGICYIKGFSRIAKAQESQ